MPTLMVSLLSHWRAIGKPVQIMRCDNAGENKTLETTTQHSMYQLGITFEYTARSTPEQNSRVEKSIDTKYNRTRACITFAHIPDPIKHLLIRECITQVTNAANIRLHEANGTTTTSYEHFFAAAPLYAPHLHVFGEAAVVHTTNIASKKLDNRGKLMMFVGNSPQHSGNVCRLFDADTGRVVVSRDVKFIGKLYYRSDQTKTALVPHPNDIVLNRVHPPPKVIRQLSKWRERRKTMTAMKPTT